MGRHALCKECVKMCENCMEKCMTKVCNDMCTKARKVSVTATCENRGDLFCIITIQINVVHLCKQ